MSDGCDVNILLKTQVGKFRLVTIAIGLLAVAFGGAGHDDHNLSKASCSYGLYTLERCPYHWAGQMALAFIIIAWLFSIIMAICSIMTSLSANPHLRMADVFGHIGAGVALILSVILIAVYVYSWMHFLACDDKAKLNYGHLFRFKEEDCVQFVLATVTYEEGPGSYTGGAKCWIWLAAAVFAIPYAVFCFLLFATLKKAPRGPMMMGGMMTQQPSQAPMSMHPSQMTQQQQQQNPDQQSVHPSQMTQQA